MTIRGGHRAALLTAAVALAASGCGGGDGPTRAEYVKEANAVCKRHYVKISAAASKLLAGGKLPTPQQFGQLAQGTIIPEYSAQIDELREVEPSEEQAAAHDAWLDDSQALKTKLQGNPVLIQDAKALTPVNAQADRLGLSDECHIGPS